MIDIKETNPKEGTMIRLAVILAVTLTVSACDKEATPAPATPATPAGPSASVIPKTPAATPPIEIGAAKPAGPAVTDAAKEATATVKEAAKDTTAAVTDAAKETLDAAEVIKDSFTLDKLKAAVGSLSSINLVEIANKLLAGINDKQGATKGLQEQIKGLGIVDLGKAAELKTQLTTITGALKGLQGKLGVVVEKLKASGVDVSKYTALLGA